MKQYLSLREQYPRFAYRGYEIEENDSCLKITYRFETLGLSEFAPVWVFPKAEGDCRRWSEDRLMQDMIFSLGMVELISYWKIACPPTVTVEAGRLNQDQIDWWKDLYFNGLGEFFYVNGIKEADPNHFMDIRCVGQHETQCVGQLKDPCTDQYKERHEECGVETDGKGNGVLVPIGGGKDSAVTLELLRLAGKPVCAYIINPRGATIHTTEVAGLDAAHVISAKRTLDSNMLELNCQGYLNGHTPFSALVAFSGIIAARMHGLSMVALSNESSANESTVQGSTVNHQYSKSFKFTDINFAVASREDKEAMFLEYSELLNSLDSGATTKITINNRRLNRLDFERNYKMDYAGDFLDVYREEKNGIMLENATGANAIVQDKYVTISVNKKSIEEARNYFARVGADLIAHFGRLGSKCYEMEPMTA